MSSSPEYILSGLSERSLCLADSAGDGSSVIFTNTVSDDPGLGYLLDRCKEKGYEVTPRDINAVVSSLEPFDPPVVIMLTGDDESDIQNAMRLAVRYGGEPRISIYCFLSSPESEYIIDGMNISNYRSHAFPMKLRRVLPVRHEIYRYLYEHAPFSDAKTINDEKWINYVIIGLCEYGMEMLRAILWFGQMEGYFLRVDVFDTQADIEDRFFALCPGISERGSLPRMGEDYYDLHFHPGIGPDSQKLTETLKELPETSHVFIDIGSDRRNTDLAIKLRSFYSGLYIDRGIFAPHAFDSVQSPRITAVVKNDARASLFRENAIRNYKDQYFQIECTGCNSDVYSVKNIINDPIGEKALELHLSSLDRESFEMHEYFRRSSAASAIHRKYRGELVADETAMAVTEHRRWCAYMRSTEGYSYGTTRDDLAKRHPSLVPYAHLGLIEQEKDRRLNQDA